MTIWKKALSIGTSAALLASLLTAIAAPAAFASVAVTSVGTIPVGGTSSGTATFLFTERTASSLVNAPGSLTVTINDVDGGNVTFSGTPSVSAPGSLGASASVAGNVLTVSWLASDTANVETIQITGLKIKADSLATTGPVSATLGGTYAPFFAAPTTATASGVIQGSNELLAGADSADIALTSVCQFNVTGGLNSKASFSDAADARDVTAVAAPVAGIQSVTFGTGVAAHAAGVTVTQTVDYSTACTGVVLPSPVGVIANAAAFSAGSVLIVYPGENNAGAGNLLLEEQSTSSGIKFFSESGTDITLSITTPGVTFSTRPLVWDWWNGSPAVQMTLSADRRSATVTWVGNNTLWERLSFYNIFYDVAGSVPGGTYVTVSASLSGGLLVNPSTAQNALVNRGISASAAPATVYIGENAQKSGLTTITELQAGFFTDGLGSNNTFAVCLSGPEWFTSPGPWAKVTSGDLRLREGTVASPDNIVAGTAIFNSTFGDYCYTWTVWTASTTASTIVIGNSDFTSGPLIDVPANTTPGTVPMDIYIGTDLFSLFNNSAATVQIATRMFRNQVVVTALSQPVIPAGSTDALAGDIQVAETAAGQLKANETICVEVLPRTSNQAIQDTFLKSLNTADIPVATASGGVIIDTVTMSTLPCSQTQPTVTPPGTHTVSFSFRILQQSTTGTGKVVISNIHYVTVADAPAGNVLVNVFGLGGSPTNVEFQSTISNAKIGNGIGGTAATAKGVTSVGPFTTSTKVVAKGKYVTYRFDFGFAAAGKAVKIWGSTKTGADWSPWAVVTTRVANASGVVYYYVRQSSATWKSYRAQWVDGGLTTPARQARWL